VLFGVLQAGSATLYIAGILFKDLRCYNTLVPPTCLHSSCKMAMKHIMKKDCPEACR